jgi:plasmid stability protein
VRTTLTLDDDVARRLQAEARRSGRPFQSVVNECLRAALAQQRTRQDHPAFQVESIPFGGLREGLSVDSIADLLENLEGSAHR